MTIPPMPAHEFPATRTEQPESEYVGRHVRRESVISTKLRDHMTRMWVRAGLVVPHVARHRADEQVAS